MHFLFPNFFLFNPPFLEFFFFFFSPLHFLFISQLHQCDDFLNFPCHFLGAVLPAPSLYPCLVQTHLRNAKPQFLFWHSQFVLNEVKKFVLKNHFPQKKKRSNVYFSPEKKNVVCYSAKIARLIRKQEN